jgi:hypothetical protein
MTDWGRALLGLRTAAIPKGSLGASTPMRFGPIGQIAKTARIGNQLD